MKREFICDLLVAVLIPTPPSVPQDEPLGYFYNQCYFILLISVKKGGKSALHKIAQPQMLKEYLYFN